MKEYFDIRDDYIKKYITINGKILSIQRINGTYC
jgi:hypothetical protein